MERWPTSEELQKLQAEELARAERLHDDPDPICDCGMPGYVCCCEAIAKELGYWQDGSEYKEG
jgi:hypothetical protein